MSEKLKKYILEEASELSEASFILCTKRPWFRAKIHIFKSLKTLLEFKTDNPTIQVNKLPILLEVIEIEENYNENQFRRSLKQMPHWYFHSQINNSTPHPPAGSLPQQ